MDEELQKSQFVGLKEFRRVTLTLDQAIMNRLPSIPIKEANDEGERGDPRSPGYKAKFGDRCWELDALQPDILRRLDSNSPLLTFDLEQKRAEEDKQRAKLKEFSR